MTIHAIHGAASGSKMENGKRTVQYASGHGIGLQIPEASTKPTKTARQKNHAHMVPSVTKTRSAKIQLKVHVLTTSVPRVSD
jgi:hypothetical protein